MPKGGKHGEEISPNDGIKTDMKKTRNMKNLKTIKRNNKVFQALNLPTICNLNPRSVYNKCDEFHTFVKEEEVDLLLMSESC